MKTKEIKEELDRELDEATPNIDEKKVKKHKIKLIDDSTIAAHKTMDRLKYITAAVLFVVFSFACFLIITNLVKFDDKPPMKTEVTCYIVTGLLPEERVHVVTKNGVVVERFSIGDFADIYMEYDDSVKNYKGAKAADYIHNLIMVMTKKTQQQEVTIKLQAVNNSYEKTKQELQNINEEIIRLNVDDQLKIHLDTEAIQHAGYNSIINLTTFIDDLDSDLDIILANDVKKETEG